MSDLETMTATPYADAPAIAPVTMRNLAPAIRAAMPIIADVRAGKLDLDALKKGDWFAWLGAFDRHGQALTEAVAHLSGATVDEAMSWTPDIAIAMATRVVRTNVDFFASLARQAVRAQTTPEPGPTPSND